MQYESMRPLEAPYKLWIGAMGNFTEHRHSDLEFSYCFSGEFTIEIEKKIYSVKSGDLLIIPPMFSHGNPVIHKEKVQVLSAILGLSFLKNYSTDLFGLRFQNLLFPLNRECDEHLKLQHLLEETIQLCRNPSPTSALKKTGNLYNITAYLIELFAANSSVIPLSHSDRRKISSVERALEIIYHQYPSAIDVDQAAAAAGYSKSNFCRVFKEVVGESFHKRLNRHRINCSMGLLCATSMSISDIATSVGFPETKSFCRVFREIMGITPSEYRDISNT